MAPGPAAAGIGRQPAKRLFFRRVPRRGPRLVARIPNKNIAPRPAAVAGHVGDEHVTGSDRTRAKTPPPSSWDPLGDQKNGPFWVLLNRATSAEKNRFSDPLEKANHHRPFGSSPRACKGGRTRNGRGPLFGALESPRRRSQVSLSPSGSIPIPEDRDFPFTARPPPVRPGLFWCDAERVVRVRRSRLMQEAVVVCPR